VALKEPPHLIQRAIALVPVPDVHCLASVNGHREYATVPQHFLIGLTPRLDLCVTQGIGPLASMSLSAASAASASSR
jgi:hypothetical protein